jgi:predicted nucleic acid-binding protein
MPGAECFVDTNVLVYAVSTRPDEAAKAAVARNILDSQDWAWSAQVAAEFVNVTTSSKRAERLTLQQAERWIDTWLAFPLAPLDAVTVKAAIQTAALFRISYFDAQIVAAARRLGCPLIYSEDLNDGQDYGGVRVINPFRQ